MRRPIAFIGRHACHGPVGVTGNPARVRRRGLLVATLPSSFPPDPLIGVSGPIRSGARHPHKGTRPLPAAGRR